MTTVAAMEYALSRKFDRGIRLSAEYLNWACNQVIHNRSDDRGQFFHHLLKGYERYGICTESEMPYAKKFLPEYRPTTQATNSASVIRSYGLRPHWIRTNDGTKGISASQLEEIKGTLCKGWPVCAGSYHSVLLIGYKDDSSLAGGGAFNLRDSATGREETMSYQESRARLCDVLWFDVEEKPAQ